MKEEGRKFGLKHYLIVIWALFLWFLKLIFAVYLTIYVTLEYFHPDLGDSYPQTKLFFFIFSRPVNYFNDFFLMMTLCTLYKA
jgi:hypothetical protein